MLQTTLVGSVPSAMDTAWEMIRQGQLDIFDSVLAESQTQGRGQFRHEWKSPVGNIYAAFRLPHADPFLGPEASVAVSALIGHHLAAIGYPIRIKWMNDIAVLMASGPAKICGILLEERHDAILAGIGINIVSHPPMAAMRENTALAAGDLGEAAAQLGLPVPERTTLWKDIAAAFAAAAAQQSWHRYVSELLLWKGEDIEVIDGDSRLAGILEGVGPQGSLLLRHDGRVESLFSGSIRKG